TSGTFLTFVTFPSYIAGCLVLRGKSRSVKNVPLAPDESLFNQSPSPGFPRWPLPGPLSTGRARRSSSSTPPRHPDRPSPTRAAGPANHRLACFEESRNEQVWPRDANGVVAVHWVHARSRDAVHQYHLPLRRHQGV